MRAVFELAFRHAERSRLPVAAARPAHRSRLARRNILVVAPHPDDDAIGCGGTVAGLAGRRARIAVTYVTDGSASHRSKRFPPHVLRDVREAEARTSLRQLGVRCEPEFLRAPDGGLASLGRAQRERLVAAVARRIASVGARIVLAPWPRDPHPDHVATAQIVGEAVARGARRPTLYYYGVWLPMRGDSTSLPRPGEVRTYEVRLGGVALRKKRAAIFAHRSQLGEIVDDDPSGFCIDEGQLATWLAPVERFYRMVNDRTTSACPRGL